MLLAVSARPEAPARPAPGGFAFAALGDAPYGSFEETRFKRVLAQLDASDLAFVLHVGDILGQPCRDELYQKRLADFTSLRHPLIYTPGDNEWTDCHERGSGGYAPLERLARLRAVFFPDKDKSLGGAPLAVVSQGGSGPYPEFVENARWSYAGVIFATVHMVGSANAREPFPGRGAADDAEAARRTEAAIAWLRSAFATARETGARAVVVAFHADMGLEQRPGSAERRPYEAFLATLEDEALRFPGPVGIAHGDGHEFKVDHPLVDRASGRRLANVTRLEVPGSPDVGWVRVVVDPGAAEPFRCDVTVIPWWLLW